MNNRLGTTAHTELLLASAVVLGALLLRVLVARDAFWLDEIWSYYFSRNIDNPIDILSVIRHDNNHPLNTLFMYWLGEQPNWFTYRIPSLLSGTAVVMLLAPAARAVGARPVIVMLLGALSLPLIQYSAEARGYSLATLFGLAAWLVYYTRLQRQAVPGWTVLFWLLSILGFLAHLSFIFVFIAIGASWLVNYWLSDERTAGRFGTGLVVFVLPGLAFIGLYAIFYSQLVYGGGQIETDVLGELLHLSRLLTGAPDYVFAGPAACLTLTALCITGIRRMQRDLQVYFTLVLLLVPAPLLAIYSPEFFYPRYVLVCTPFAYLAVGHAISHLIDFKGFYRVIALALLGSFVVGSALLYRPLVEFGKGDYVTAVAQLFAHPGNDTFTVGSDFDFRNRMLLDFYTRYRSDANRLSYVENASATNPPVDYFIMHNRSRNTDATEFRQLGNGGIYQIAGIYPYAGLSGWSWYLYKLIAVDSPVTQE